MYTLFTDGGARGNPGPAATAALLFNQSNELVDFAGEYLGSTTNNQAEYRALLIGLQMAVDNGVQELLCNLDSELVVMQLNGAYRVKHKELIPLFEQIKELRTKFPKITFAHVRREKNKFADKLANLLMDAAQNN